jgi:hypothetical protein
MRNVIAIFFFTIFYNLTLAQKNIPGSYQDLFGNNIELNGDSIFKYTWIFDLASSWTIGKWTYSHDTIHFQIVPIMDTLRYYDKNLKTQIDTLVLSMDNKPEVISMTDYTLTQITSGGQNIYKMPSKLYYRKDRLYNINKNGKLIIHKVKGIWTNKKYDPWYFKK